jgi:hypothetical protein
LHLVCQDYIGNCWTIARLYRHNPLPKGSAELLDRTRSLAAGFLQGLAERPVRSRAPLAELQGRLDVPLADEPLEPLAVVEELARNVDAGLVATAGPRYFGFVIGGSLPAALAADWLTSAWDQNAGLYAGSPAAAVVEDVAAGWLLDLLGLPKDASVGFVTGCQMANFSGLAAGRHAVLARAGTTWRMGSGAPSTS